MWVPRWLGESYAKLYAEFDLGLFRFSDAVRVLELSESMAKAVVSGLHRHGLLTIFERRRPRIYRLISPESFILLASGEVRKVEIPQERYLELIYACFRALRKIINLKSLAVYGSVARGTASENSDLDLLVVSGDFKGSIGRRIELLVRTVRADVKDELRFLRSHGYNASISFYPLKPSEVEKLPIILLDLVEDARIVYDKNEFLKGVLLKLKHRLVEMGARRVRTKRGWYWDLKPDLKPLEVIEL